MFPDNTAIAFGIASGSLTSYSNVGSSTNGLHGYFINELMFPITFQSPPIKVVEWSIGNGFAWDAAGISIFTNRANIYGIGTLGDTQFITTNICIFGIKA